MFVTFIIKRVNEVLSDELTALKLISAIFEKGFGEEKGHDKVASQDRRGDVDSICSGCKVRVNQKAKTQLARCDSC